MSITFTMHPNLHSKFSRYVVSLFVTAFSLLLRGILDPVIGDYVPYLAVLPAVVFAAWFCGLGPSLVVMILAFLGEQYWFVGPEHSLKIVGTAEQAGAVVYFAVSLTIIVFADNNRRVIDKLAVSRAEVQRASDELGRSHAELEQRVVERTGQLQEKNTELLTQAAVVRQLSARLLQMQDEERRRIARQRWTIDRRDVHESFADTDGKRAVEPQGCRSGNRECCVDQGTLTGNPHHLSPVAPSTA
jgi:K+-sensing histidine kinase KdpD